MTRAGGKVSRGDSETIEKGRGLVVARRDGDQKLRLRDSYLKEDHRRLTSAGRETKSDPT